jgi:rRNA-processing protein FCF1
MLNTNTTTDSQQALILDETTLSILVSDRLDLQISRSLLDRHFKRPIIEKCWKNQLRIKSRRKNKRNLISDIQLFI